MEIELLNSKATVKEVTDIIGNTSQTVEDAAIADVYLENECSDLKTMAATMRKGIGTEYGKELSEVVFDADATRDNLLTTLNYFVKGYQQWNKPETAPAANKIAKAIESVGTGIAWLSYEKESAALDSLLDKLDEPELKAAVETINQTTLTEELKAAQGNFKTLYKQSALVESQKGERVSPTKMKPLAEKKLESIINYLNIMSRANSATYGAVAATVAELVNTLNGKIRNRNNRGNGNGDGSNTNETSE